MAADCPYTQRMPIRFTHTDPAGYVFFPRYFEMWQDVKELLEANNDLPYLRLLKQQGLTEVEEFLFMLVCQRTLTGDPEVDLEQVVGIVAGAPHARIRLKRSIFMR